MILYSKLHALLLESGLGEAEALTYIELLKKPADTVWDLAKRVGISKSTVYRAFEKLQQMKMVEKSGRGIRALSLKDLVLNLNKRVRKADKLVDKIKRVAPFLRAPEDSIKEFEILCIAEDIAEAYLFMSELRYDTNLDFGDFENFIPTIGGINIALKFRQSRLKHASHRAITTTFGPQTAHFCTREAEQKYKNKIDVLDLDFGKNFVIFSDTSDWVLFNEFEDPGYPSSVLVRSKAIADVQRKNFRGFSRRFGN